MMSAERLVYLVRHGLAGEAGPEYPDDSKRPLTPRGVSRMREVAAGLATLGVELDAILTSPFTRTRETADVLAAAWSPAPPVSALDALAVDGRTSGVLTAITASDVRRLALVGHMPGLGVLGAELLGLVHPLEFRKGGVACLALDGLPRRGGATLLWFVPPRLLRLAAKRR